MNDASSSAASADPPCPTLAEGGQEACDELVKKTEADPGSTFASDVVRDLAALKLTDRMKFESLRSRLRDAKCRVTELDRLIAAASGEARAGRDPDDADILTLLADAAELFQDINETAYADIDVKGHRETWAVRSHGFRRWLRRRFYEETRSAPASEALNAALNVIEAKAQHDTPVREVYVRVAGLDDRIYLDLCDSAWRAIEADRAGWRIVERPPVRFRRSPEMRALPVPEEGGSVDSLRRLLNIRDGEEGDNDLVLAITWALGGLRGRGPYSMMVITGEQGTAKSTRAAMLRNLIDPGKPTLRALPRDERDLVIAARTRHVLAFDNVSGLPFWLSDALCRIASGAGFGTRQLYTDADEVVFEGARPLISNGIEDVVERPDLAERSIFSVCELIDPENRLSEDEVWASFRAAHASVLGALLDAVAEGFRNFSEIRPLNLPRMADFAHWATACEPALWEIGAFMRAYNANIQGAVESVLEAIPVAVAVRKLMEDLAAVKQTQWKGTSSELLAKLTPLVDERTAKSDAWPRNGRALSGRLRRAASFLRRIGILVLFTREGRAMTRQIVITTHTPSPKAQEAGRFASAPSAPSASGTGSSQNNGLGTGPADGRVPDADANPSMQTQTAHPTVCANPLKSDRADGADGADAKMHASTRSEKGYVNKEGMRLRALDLCCCAGGATRGLQQAGLHVTGIDVAPQPNYCGDMFILGDALEFLERSDLSQFEFIWASPPCQAYSVLKHAPGQHRDADLVGPTRELLIRSGLPYVIENVEGAPLIDPTMLCGTMFGLKSPVDAELRRHRLFEASFPLSAPGPCQHSGGPVMGVYGGHFRNRRRPYGENHSSDSNWPREHGFIAMGVDWPMTNDEISEAIPPAFSKFIAEQWLAQAAVLVGAAS
jgi:hypothetical protein